jgi:hypothetical protein
LTLDSHLDCRAAEASIPANVRDTKRVQRKIVLDEIESLMVLHHPGQSAADKKRKIELLRAHFHASWTEMEEVMPLFDLRAGYESLHQELEGKPSRYGVREAQPAPEMNDGIPDFLRRDKPEQPPVVANGFDERGWINAYLAGDTA